MEFILNILYIYVALYTLFFLALSIRNLNGRKFELQKKYSAYEEKDNIAVVIYAHNNRENLENLVNELKSTLVTFGK